MLGVILNLAVWFGMHVVFGTVETRQAGLLRFTAPDWATLEWRMVVIVVASIALLMRLRWSVHAVLGAMAVVALVWR